MIRHSVIAIAALLLVSACGSDKPLKCKGPTDYLQARPAPRVEAPEDLDDLDKLKEMPVPEVSPQEVSAEEGECLDSPPEILEK